MADIIFTINVDTTNETVTFTNNGSDLTGITTLTLYMRGEDKTSYVVTVDMNITLFNSTGDIYTYLELFGVAYPVDNCYLTEIIGNESDSDTITASVKLLIGFTYEIAELIHNSTLGITIPVNNLLTSLTLGGMPQILEYLQTLSTDTTYSENRENKWRKAYNNLYITVNDLDY